MSKPEDPTSGGDTCKAITHGLLEGATIGEDHGAFVRVDLHVHAFEKTSEK